MNMLTLERLACPYCHGALGLEGAPPDAPLDEGLLICPACARSFPISHGIPRFIDEAELTGPNGPLARLYDRIAGLYLTASRLGHALAPLLRSPRSAFMRRLAPHGGCILEVSIGPGTNLPYLFASGQVDLVVGLDISGGQLEQAWRYSVAHGWPVDLVHGQAEALPFRDNCFDGVLTVGGFNFFSDQRSALQEMIRVARPGARVVISDENERLAKVYEWTIPGFKASLGGQRPAARAPTELIPDGLDDLHIDQLWGGSFYCVHFRKPAVPQAQPDVA